MIKKHKYKKFTELLNQKVWVAVTILNDSTDQAIKLDL